MMTHTSGLATHGFTHIKGQFYLDHGVASEQELTGSSWMKALEKAYREAILDPYSAGSRTRSYAQFQYDGSQIRFGKFFRYYQTKSYNPDTGGVVRDYPLIAPELLENPIFLKLIKSDIDFVAHYQLLGSISDLEMGVHLFRYNAHPNHPSYSSPIWLHKDDEDVVFIHHLRTSSNAVGGDSIIAPNGKHIEQVIRLSQPLETLVVNHLKFHAVTPIGTNDEQTAERDVILVTFQKRRLNEYS